MYRFSDREFPVSFFGFPSVMIPVHCYIPVILNKAGWSEIAGYKSETEKPYFVDKTSMLEELFPLVRTGNNHICITRPRRFGKTVTANMIASFFSRTVDAQDIFQSLSIADAEDYGKYRNQFSVIHISFNELGGMCLPMRNMWEKLSGAW